jgi:predicted transcriptional regulator of viral defense system
MRLERNVEPNKAVKHCVSANDQAIAEVAERQHGLISRGQLLELGLERWSIWHRLEIGRLHPVHRGVYAVGHRVLSSEGRWMAAVLAIGGDAVLSHRSAAGLWSIRYPANVRIEVTTPRRVRPPSGVRGHRSALPADEVTVLHGIPVTTVPRTLLDLATVLGPRQVERSIEEANIRRLDDPLSLPDLVERYPGRRDTGVIRAILAADRIGSTITRSELEERFLALLETYSLPSPELNVPIEVRGSWLEVDCVWRRWKLIVELDGHASHGTASAFERDRARDRVLHAVGWRVLRITWRQLNDEAERIAADLRALLGSG